MTTEPQWLLDAHQRASERMADAERAGLDPHDTLMAGLRAAFKLHGLISESREAMEATGGEIRRVNVNDDGSLDEVVGSGRFHLEQMSDNCWFLNLGGLCLMLVVRPEHKRVVTASPVDGGGPKQWADWKRWVRR